MTHPLTEKQRDELLLLLHRLFPEDQTPPEPPLTDGERKRLADWASEILTQDAGHHLSAKREEFTNRLVNAYLKTGVSGLIINARKFEQERSEKLFDKI